MTARLAEEAAGLEYAPLLPALPPLPQPPSRTARAPFILNDFIKSNPAADRLALENVPDTHVFAGVAGNESLSLIAAGRYANAVLFDLNETDVKAAHNVLKLVESSDSPEQFIDAAAPRMQRWLTQEPAARGARAGSQGDEAGSYFAVLGIRRFPVSAEDIRSQLREMADNPQSWLHPRHFGYIRAMQRQGRIQTARMDITDPEAVQALDRSVRAAGLAVGALYTSTIRRIIASHEGRRDYFDRESATGTERFDAGVHTLLRAEPGDHDARLSIQTEVYGNPIGHHPAAETYAPEDYRRSMKEKETVGRLLQSSVPHGSFRAGDYVLQARTTMPRPDKPVGIVLTLSAVVRNGRRMANPDMLPCDLDRLAARLEKELPVLSFGEVKVNRHPGDSAGDVLSIELPKEADASALVLRVIGMVKDTLETQRAAPSR